jgi:alkanesulfonate monooxygenase SsuD/methylene tetrahydromethanopterin reductase-like flavin-dependent oxidoreductase (luciferase family)
VLHLTVSLAGNGYHPASWRVSRLPSAPDGVAAQRMARAAERGKLDAVLLGLPVDGAAGVSGANCLPLDPLPLLGSLIGVTQRIGLAAAWAVDYAEPFHVARVFASLDYLSHGRSGWIVDLFGAAALAPRIGRPPPPIDIAAYCRQAGEFVDVVRKLCDSWEDAAFVLDKASGTFVDPELVHAIEHDGAFFKVRGPLNVPRPPQGNPVLILHDPQDRAAREFAALTADVVLISCATSMAARERCRELRALAGSRPLRVLANIEIVLGDSEGAARRRAAELDAMLPTHPGPRFVGAPEQLVALFAEWREANACDGFNLLPAVLDDLDLLVDQAVPLGQSAGILRTEYTGATLREHFGLARPPSRYEGSAG